MLINTVELLPAIGDMAKKKYQAMKHLAHVFFEHYPTETLSTHGDHFIPFEDDVEALPPRDEDPWLWYDLQGYPHVNPKPPIHTTHDHFVMNRDEQDLGWDK